MVTDAVEVVEAAPGLAVAPGLRPSEPEAPLELPGARRAQAQKLDVVLIREVDGRWVVVGTGVAHDVEVRLARGVEARVGDRVRPVDLPELALPTPRPTGWEILVEGGPALSGGGALLAGGSVTWRAKAPWTARVVARPSGVTGTPLALEADHAAFGWAASDGCGGWDAQAAGASGCVGVTKRTEDANDRDLVAAQVGVDLRLGPTDGTHLELGGARAFAPSPERADAPSWLARQTVASRVELTGVLRLSPAIDLRAGYHASDAGLELGWIGLEAPARGLRAPGSVSVRGSLGLLAVHGHPDGEYVKDQGLWLGGGLVWRPR